MTKIFAKDKYDEIMGVRTMWKQVKESCIRAGTITICQDCLKLKTVKGWTSLDNETKIRVVSKADKVQNELCSDCEEKRKKIKRLEVAAQSCSSCGI